MKNKWSLGHTKLQTYLENIARKEVFISDLKKIRKELKLPENGIDTVIENTAGSFNFHKKEKLLNLIDWLVDKHKMGMFKSAEIPLEYLVLYDKIVLPEYYDVCAIQDLKQQDWSKNRYGETLYSDSTHPISIRISPHASEREIIDFIKSNYTKYLRPLQTLYKNRRSTIGKNRKRTSRTIIIADFIYENRDLSSKEISEKMKAEIGIRKFSWEITKIKNSEIKRRK
jgi:hypothetical protein